MALTSSSFAADRDLPANFDLANDLEPVNIFDIPTYLNLILNDLVSNLDRSRNLRPDLDLPTDPDLPKDLDLSNGESLDFSSQTDYNVLPFSNQLCNF